MTRATRSIPPLCPPPYAHCTVTRLVILGLEKISGGYSFSMISAMVGVIIDCWAEGGALTVEGLRCEKKIADFTIR